MMLDFATGIVLIGLGLLTALFRGRFESYLDKTAGKAARDLADHGLTWSWDVYPTSRRLLTWITPPVLVLIGAVFVALGLTG
jgi:hypothetical protein